MRRLENFPSLEHGVDLINVEQVAVLLLEQKLERT